MDVNYFDVIAVQLCRFEVTDLASETPGRSAHRILLPLNYSTVALVVTVERVQESSFVGFGLFIFLSGNQRGRGTGGVPDGQCDLPKFVWTMRSLVPHRLIAARTVRHASAPMLRIDRREVGCFERDASWVAETGVLPDLLGENRQTAQ